jgi:hypothetical protein
VYACFVDELFCCFPQHLALFILSLFALTGFIDLKLDVMPYVKNKNGYTRVLLMVSNMVRKHFHFPINSIFNYGIVFS